ncbi:MAG: hypothetical protein ACAH80_13305 [Alphaproteobacteria bacterium]
MTNETSKAGETQKPAEAPKKTDRSAKWFYAGTLTLAAAAAFVLVTRPPAPPLADDVSLQQSIATQQNLYPAITKDKQAVRVYLDIKTLDRGANYNDDFSFSVALQGQATLAVMQEVMKYTAAELPANATKIQQAVSDQLANTVVVGKTADGSPVLAQQGVNFGAPKIDKITDARGENLLYRAPILPTDTPIFRFGT